MSKNLKTLLCCILSLVFVAGTIVAVFADSNDLFAAEAESVTAEDVTAEDVTAEVEVEVDESTTKAPETTTEAEVDESTTAAEVDESTTAKADDETSTKPVAGDDDDSKKLRLGDVNFDGVINAADARIALRISAKLHENPTADELYVADVTGDGFVHARDARRILRVSAQLDKEADFGKDI